MLPPLSLTILLRSTITHYSLWCISHKAASASHRMTLLLNNPVWPKTFVQLNSPQGSWVQPLHFLVPQCPCLPQCPKPADNPGLQFYPCLLRSFFYSPFIQDTIILAGCLFGMGGVGFPLLVLSVNDLCLLHIVPLNVELLCLSVSLPHFTVLSWL